MAGFVYLVGAGPGDPGLLTVRAQKVLQQAEVVVADRLVSPQILEAEVPASAELIMRGARADGAAQAEINALLVERAQRGQVVVRLKGGDPFVFGRGGEEAEALVAAGIAFAVVPGVTAAVAAPAYAGIPLTHRGIAGAVAFATGHETEDKSGGAIGWTELAHAADTLVLYMSVTHLDEVMRRLRAAGRRDDVPVAVIERGTTGEQRVVVGNIGDIVARVTAAGVTPPALTIVGRVVELRDKIRWFEQRRRILLISTKEPSEHDDARLPLDVDVTQVAPLQIVPRFAEVKQALARLDETRSLAFVSAHAVDSFCAALHASGFDSRALFGRKLATVGRATAERLLRHGLRADLVGEGGGAELGRALVREASGPALVFGAAGGRPELAEVLGAAGWSVAVVAAYDSVPDAAALARALKTQRIRPFDAIAFTSPRGVDAFCDLAGDALATTLGTTRLGAIGATTAAALSARGLAVAVTPDTPDVVALVTSLAALAKLE
jgi:uroporphyrinogen III methyltransferase/synthase